MIRDWYNQNENSDPEIKMVNNLIYIDTFYTEEILLTDRTVLTQKGGQPAILPENNAICTHNSWREHRN